MHNIHSKQSKLENSTVCRLMTTLKTEKSVLRQSINQPTNQALFFFVRPKGDQRAGQHSLPHVGITNTERNGTKT